MSIPSPGTPVSPHGKRVRRAKIPPHGNFCRGAPVFRGCSHSITFGLLRSLGPQVAPTATPKSVEPPGLSHHASPGRLPNPGCGVASRSTWTTDVAGLPPAGSQPCRLLLPAHGSPTVFLTPRRTRPRSECPTPLAGSHPDEHQRHRHPNPAAAWQLPIARARVVAPQRPEWPQAISLETTATGIRLPGYWHRSSRPPLCLARTSIATTTEVRALRSRRVVLHADPHYYDPLGLPLPSARLHHWLILDPPICW